MGIAQWAPYFRKKYGDSLPNDYLSLDLEYTGFAENDLITEIGHCLVYARQPSPGKGGRMTTLLNWTTHPDVDQDWLRDQLKLLKQRMEFDRDGQPTGKTCHVTYERLQQEGHDPEETLQFYHQLLTRVRDTGGFFIGHNVFGADSRVLKREFAEWVGTPWEFRANEVFDVGAMEKAVQAGLRAFEDESMRTYFSRVQGVRKAKVFWSVEHCIQKYGLVDKYGIDPAHCHGAGFDAYATHLVFEEMRQLAGLA